jgi:hypothetical protein
VILRREVLALQDMLKLSTAFNGFSDMRLATNQNPCAHLMSDGTCRTTWYGLAFPEKLFDHS